MTTAELIKEVQGHQALLLDNVRRAGEEDYGRQFHPDLSPLGWHLGHCVFTEIYWLRERLLNDNDQSDALKALYVPELMPKQKRAAELPDFDTLIDWAQRIQDENRELLEELLNSHGPDPLLEDGFVAHFLSQHYAQHYETTMYVHAQHRQQLHCPAPAAHTQGAAPSTKAVTVPAGHYEIGTPDNARAYDNELPVFNVRLETFHIAVKPVSNSEYLRFMEDNGYNRDEFWSPEGRRWRREHGIFGPEHWRRDEHGLFYMIDDKGSRPLPADDPVFGISHFEACAFARWAGARLPHEYEWEAAKKSGALDGDGRVWEWCANAFHPYEGFNAFPYDGYSLPWFNDRHFSLRGGSDYTRACIRRPGFRNYYQAGKRHIRAGLRLVFP
ncbi:MAG: SUMF1/EgtB/PvdO family nonheme iron enzyme [Gammaproteobacteria bacterium]